MRVLICDDQKAIHESLRAYFTHAGFHLDSAFSGEQALALIQAHRFDIIILDIMLPDMDGFRICQKIRETSTVPILFLSARDQLEDRLLGLRLGGDDYVIKPFSPREVVLRAETILRRAKPAQSEQFPIGDLLIHPQAYFVSNLEQTAIIPFTPKEFEVFLFLCKHENQVISRNQLIEALWGFDYQGDLRSIDTFIKRLRLKLQAQTTRITIRSVYGVGYKLEVGNS
ncbi:MAG: response regulator transcription factor [Culicoidibacterales bacterium]